MQSSSMICFKNVSFSYEQNKIIEHFDLCIPKGTFLTVIGSSGYDKWSFTTTVWHCFCRRE